MIVVVLHCFSASASTTGVQSSEFEVCEMAKIATFAAVRVAFYNWSLVQGGQVDSGGYYNYSEMHWMT